MVRKNNKGFSLLEVMIAVFILTLLMAPIIAKLTQTIKTSAQAKEKQYAVENAEYVLNVFQSTPMSEITEINRAIEKGASSSDRSITKIAPDAVNAYSGNAGKPNIEFTSLRTTYGSSSANLSSDLSCDVVVYGCRRKSSPTSSSTVLKTEYETVEDYYGSTVDSFDFSSKMVNPQKEGASVLEGSLSEPVTYKATSYTLAPETLGRDNNTYQRSIIMDNLRTQLLARGYIIETNFSEDEIKTLSAAPYNYTITTEGAAVKYDRYYKNTGVKVPEGTSAEAHEYYELISEVVCSWVTGVDDGSGYMTGALKNPNGIGTSYMQDLDSTKVAIIQGSASSFDEQAEADLYAAKLNRLRDEDEAAWEDAIKNKRGSDILSTANYIDNVSKLTKISIVSAWDATLDEEGNDTGEGRLCYNVECTVYYEDYLTSIINPEKSDEPVKLSYVAYNRTFYTNQAPDIYFIYEPYVAGADDSGNLHYSQNDYILTYDGVEYKAGEKHSKLYLIRPKKGRASSYYTKGDIINGVEMTSDTPEYERKTYTTTLGGGGENPVHVNLNYIKNNSGPNNGPLQIYTNLNIDTAAGNFVYERPGDEKKGVQSDESYEAYMTVPMSSDAEHHNTGTVPNSSLSREPYPLVHPYDEASYKQTFGTTNYNNGVVTKFYQIGENNDPVEDLRTVRDIYNDRIYSERLFTVTIQMDRVEVGSDGKVTGTDEGYSVKLTGTKGAD